MVKLLHLFKRTLIRMHTCEELVLIFGTITISIIL